MARQSKTAQSEAPVTGVQHPSLFERVAAYLDEHDWKYTAHDDETYFTMACRLQDASVRVVLDVFEADHWERVLVYSIFPVFVPENRRPTVAEAINRLNYTIRFGNLEMDFKDGEIRMRTVIEAHGGFDHPMVERVLDANLSAANRYLACLLAVAFGNVSPHQVVDMVRKSDGETVQ